MTEQLGFPLARRTDPATSHLAASATESAVPAIEQAILAAADIITARTAFVIAERVEHANPGRWDEGTIRTRVSAMGKARKLSRSGVKGTSPRGRECDRWYAP